MLKAEDHAVLGEQFLRLAGETRVIAHRSGLDYELASVSLALLEIANVHLEASDELTRKERLMRLRNLGIFIVVMIALLLGVMALMAQDVTAEPTAVPTVEVTPEPPPTPALPPSTETPEDILGIVLATLFAGAATISGSVFVTAVVGLEKMIIPVSVASGDTLKNVTSVIVWIGYSLAIHFGLGTQFQGLASFLAPILITATPLVGVLIGSAKLYLASKEHNVPILGYQRPAPPDNTAYVR